MTAQPSEAEVLQLAMQRMREKNEAFFKHKEPSIYNFIKDKKLAHSDLRIVKSPSGELELDVVERGAKRYFDRGQHYCQKEAEKFMAQMTPGTQLPPSAPVGPHLFTFQRVGSLHFKELATELDNRITLEPNISMPNFYPLLIIMGMGLSFHIEKVVKSCDINSLIIYENNMDRILTSLYTIDWEEIYSYFNNQNGRTIQLIFSTGEDFHVHQACLWNEVVNYCPYFPFVSLFYNHLNDATNLKIIKGIQKDIVTYLQQWGNYDDEINQYNNARHNLLANSRIYRPSQFKVNPYMPIVVVGAGPSLDDRIGMIQKHREKLLVISCGTTIGTLFEYGIKPDFHVELESDYIVYEAISKATTPEYRKDITLLASVQVNPRCLALFEKSLVFFKDSTSLAELYIENKQDIINNTTPTCTNAGVALAFKMRPKNLFLFGTDFGFISKDKHHAKGSVYYKAEDEISFVLSNANNFEKEALTTTMSVHGTKIETKPMYFTAQRRVEECIKIAHLAGIKVFNCSDGASIKNSVWTPNEQLDKMLTELEVNASPASLAQEIYNISQGLNANEIDAKSQQLIDTVTRMFDILLAFKPDSSSLKDIAKYAYTLNSVVARNFRSDYGSIYFFIRGQVWIFVTVMFVYALHAKEQAQLDFIHEYCTQWLRDHKQKLIGEMRDVLFHKKSIDDDLWVNRTVEEPA